jgi:alginate O-acetyltransferase complex protein AlgI
MTLSTTVILCGVSFLIGVVRNRIIRKFLILAVSVIALFVLQPNLPIRYLGFWLPIGTLFIIISSWIITSLNTGYKYKDSLPALAIIAGIILSIGFGRSWSQFPAVIPAQPPQIYPIIISLILIGICFVLFSNIKISISTYWIIILIIIFIIIKTPFLSYLLSLNLRILSNQSTELANSIDIRWLGFSYIVFRIIHTIRDRQTGKLPVVGLADYINYVIFFPALTAGPIDRLDSFIKKFETPLSEKWEVFGEGSRRILFGLFKKFVIADSLSLIALNSTNALQIQWTGWMWVSLYAYALQIFFDFSGYTDIAIGMGRFMGIQLPENFSSPYLKPNITQFWNNWHITLTQWFRTYYFNPLTRFLRTRYKKMSITVVILLTQLSTMVLIGLWHGVTINFILWGLWHGLGLFIHNRWNNYLNSKVQNNVPSSLKKKLLNTFGILVTFNFVAIGWIFFVLPSTASSWHVILKLFGVI